MLILNEEKYAKNLYLGNNTEVKSVVGKVGYVTRYLLHTEGLSDEDNYNQTVEWMNRNHDNFDENCYSNLISDGIKKAYKRPFYNIDSINITQSELDAISSLNNLRAEKVLFVLLCMAKHQSAAFGFSNGLVTYSLPELCKTARISVPTEEREYILYSIVKAGLLRSPKKNDTKCLIVDFMDYSSDIVLELDEMDCQELAYSYLNWKNNGNGYGRCELCGKLIKQSKTNPRRFCKGCLEIIGEIPEKMKVISCISCGELVYTSMFDSATCRCDVCQAESRKNSYNKYNAKRRCKDIVLTTDPQNF